MLITRNHGRGIVYHWNYEPPRARSLMMYRSRGLMRWNAPGIITAIAHDKRGPFALCAYEGAGPVQSDTDLLGELYISGGSICAWNVQIAHRLGYPVPCSDMEQLGTMCGATCLSPIAPAIRLGKYTPTEAFWMSSFIEVPKRTTRVATIAEMTNALDLAPWAHWHFRL